ncbi:hypothetical protein [Marinobacter caseinilyticus]|uniref:hypothetical protein n=1 Tax=Marinobacter caseinilyticus TaxID=2692195 RepID=UPI0014077ACA|nr:hypothetical protein [Marinobacter caseinilyticus]
MKTGTGLFYGNICTCPVSPHSLPSKPSITTAQNNSAPVLLVSIGNGATGGPIPNRTVIG